ncbi:MAG: helix-hairpin-helix domain-containing protein [Bacillota bacterium]|nr:helix-hairpin-helix domain-containing protein [Bacillota bacterium]
MKDRILEHKYALLAVLLITAGIFFYYFDSQSSSVTQSNEISKMSDSLVAPKNEAKQGNVELTTKTVIVDVKGEVKNPGVYRSSQDERVMDVINKAGGFTGKADKNQVNLAQHIADEMVILVPAMGAAPAVPGGAENTITPGIVGENSDGNIVNLNKADETQLETLPGIGPSKALAIIEYRKKNGPFKKAEDLKEISGIGDKTFEKLKNKISVN